MKSLHWHKLIGAQNETRASSKALGYFPPLSDGWNEVDVSIYQINEFIIHKLKIAGYIWTGIKYFIHIFLKDSL